MAKSTTYSATRNMMINARCNIWIVLLDFPDVLALAIDRYGMASPHGLRRAIEFSGHVFVLLRCAVLLTSASFLSLLVWCEDASLANESFEIHARHDVRFGSKAMMPPLARTSSKHVAGLARFSCRESVPTNSSSTFASARTYTKRPRSPFVP